jgi:hypothetical protein
MTPEQIADEVINDARREARDAALEDAANLAERGTRCRRCGRVSLGYAPPKECPDNGDTKETDGWDWWYPKPKCDFDRMSDDELGAAIRALSTKSRAGGK